MTTGALPRLNCALQDYMEDRAFAGLLFRSAALSNMVIKDASISTVLYETEDTFSKRAYNACAMVLWQVC
jgi:hypothetical protein